MARGAAQLQADEELGALAAEIVEKIGADPNSFTYGYEGDPSDEANTTYWLMEPTKDDGLKRGFSVGPYGLAIGRFFHVEGDLPSLITGCRSQGPNFMNWTYVRAS